MEFWGVEVKAGQPLKVLPGDDKMIHLSQASLGESKKDGNDAVPLFLKFDDKKLVLGTLSPKNFPQISFDLVFEKEFELSHNWKNGSVYFCGYKADTPDEEGMSDYSSESEEEYDLPVNPAANGNPELKVENAKPATAKGGSAAKPKLQSKPVEPKKAEKSEDDTDGSDESEDDSDLPADADPEDSDDVNDSDDSDDESDESDGEDMSEDVTPKKAESGKKRPTESATKTPVPAAKKVKLATPQKTDGKKGSAHTATPHPSKKAAKTPAISEKSKAATPKSAGPVTCNSCSKTFNSDGALQSHTKAKHEGK